MSEAPKSHGEQRAQPRTRYAGYPAAVEAPNTPLKRAVDCNPAFSGWMLVVGAWLISKAQWLQKLLWSNAGFHALRELDLKEYSERWDPTVIPLHEGHSYQPHLDPTSVTSLPQNTRGRYHSALDLHSRYLSGELTPLAVVESLLPLIRRDLDKPGAHSVAFLECHPEALLEQARASTLRYKEGKPLSILDGVPAAAKDDSDLAGHRTRTGRRENNAIFPIMEESTWPITKLQEAGCIMLGKLNQHELGADTSNNNPNWGTPRNPHNRDYYPGGSSGGPAYAISAGLIPFAVGSDGGGSIRIPSSFCGIYGLKPSHNRLEDLGSTVAVNGPLAANMSDLEIAYRVMAAPDPSEPICSMFAPPNPHVTDHPKVLGVYEEWLEGVEPAVLVLFRQVIRYFETKHGYTVVKIQLPHVPHGQTAHAFTILAEMSDRARKIPSSPTSWLSGFNAANKVLLGVGAQTPARDFLLGQQLRQMLMEHLAFLYARHPGLIIVSPTTPLAGWCIKRGDGDLKYGVTDANISIRTMEYVWLANFCGNPAMSCPIGYVDPAKGKGQLPVGLMAMGEWASEDGLLAWGRHAERWLNEEYADGRRRPETWVDVVALAGGEKTV